jgi:hypothetical protein
VTLMRRRRRACYHLRAAQPLDLLQPHRQQRCADADVSEEAAIKGNQSRLHQHLRRRPSVPLVSLAKESLGRARQPGPTNPIGFLPVIKEPGLNHRYGRAGSGRERSGRRRLGRSIRNMS